MRKPRLASVISLTMKRIWSKHETWGFKWFNHWTMDLGVSENGVYPPHCQFSRVTDHQPVDLDPGVAFSQPIPANQVEVCWPWAGDGGKRPVATTPRWWHGAARTSTNRCGAGCAVDALKWPMEHMWRICGGIRRIPRQLLWLGKNIWKNGNV